MRSSPPRFLAPIRCRKPNGLSRQQPMNGRKRTERFYLPAFPPILRPFASSNSCRRTASMQWPSRRSSRMNPDWPIWPPSLSTANFPARSCRPKTAAASACRRSSPLHSSTTDCAFCSMKFWRNMNNSRHESERSPTGQRQRGIETALKNGA